MAPVRCSLTAALLMTAACGSSSAPVECTGHGDCDQMTGGRCLEAPSGKDWCSYPSPSCPSGYGWSDLAGDGLAGQCVVVMVDAAIPDAAIIDAMPVVDVLPVPDGSGGACTDSTMCPADEYCHFSVCIPCADLTVLGFNAPNPITEVNTAENDKNISLSPDGTKLYVISGPVGGMGTWYEWTKQSDGTWADPVTLTIPMTYYPARLTSADGVTYYFSQLADIGGTGFNMSIWQTTRTGDTFSTPTQVTVLNQANDATGFPYIAADGLSIYFQSDRLVGGDPTSDPDIWNSTYNSATGMWAAPSKLNNVSTNQNETSPSVTGDALLFSVSSSGIQPTAFLSYPAGASPVGIPDVNLPAFATESPVFAPDFCTLYFASNRTGGAGNFDVWMATRR